MTSSNTRGMVNSLSVDALFQYGSRPDSIRTAINHLGSTISIFPLIERISVERIWKVVISQQTKQLSINVVSFKVVISQQTKQLSINVVSVKVVITYQTKQL